MVFPSYPTLLSHKSISYIGAICPIRAFDTKIVPTSWTWKPRSTCAMHVNKLEMWDQPSWLPYKNRLIPFFFLLTEMSWSRNWNSWTRDYHKIWEYLQYLECLQQKKLASIFGLVWEWIYYVSFFWYERFIMCLWVWATAASISYRTSWKSVQNYLHFFYLINHFQ